MINSNSEEEILKKARDFVSDMVKNGKTDIGTDIFPFISLLMQEQHLYHYENEGVKPFTTASKKSSSLLEMVKAIGTPHDSVITGVCRHTHDSGLRLSLTMYDEYLKLTGNGLKTINTEDYIFIETWVTPISQHTTLSLVNPENRRNLYELDWGRIYKKENMSGAFHGNNIGTTFRLFKYNPRKNKTVPFDLVKSEYGKITDRDFFSENENLLVNGITSPTDFNDIEFKMNMNKSSLKISGGFLMKENPYFIASYSLGKVEKPKNKFLKFNSIAGIQTLIYENNIAKDMTLAWADWKYTFNNLNLLRYSLNAITKDFRFNKNFCAEFSSLNTIEVMGSLVYYSSDYKDVSGLRQNIDGNIWSAFSTSVNYKSDNDSIEAGISLFNRNFLMADNIQYLSPDPVTLIKHGTYVNASNGIRFHSSIKGKSSSLYLSSIFELKSMMTSYLKSNITAAKSLSDKYNILTGFELLNLINGVDYYFYEKPYLIIRIMLENSYQDFSAGIYLRKNKFDRIGFGTNLCFSFN